MNITADQIVEWIIAILPSVIAVLSFVAVIWKTLREFKATKDEVVDLKELTEVKNQMRQVLNENYELKKSIKELLTKIDKIQRK